MTRLESASFRNLNFRDMMQQLELADGDTYALGPLRVTVESPSALRGPALRKGQRSAQREPAEVVDRHSEVAGERQALLAAPGGNRSPLYQCAKRIVDLVGAGTLLVVLSPLLLVTWAVLMITTKGKPFFAQTRYGLCGTPFRLFKFRTMVSNAEDLRHLIQRDGPVFKKRGNADPRITGIGAFLRKTSIDELPQLINVLLGKMSLVGPRPLSCGVDKFETWQLERLQVKPGLTCVWQVSGRSEICFHEWMLMDLWYVRHQSLLIDAKLLWCTPRTVLSCRGAG